MTYDPRDTDPLYVYDDPMPVYRDGIIVGYDWHNMRRRLRRPDDRKPGVPRAVLGWLGIGFVIGFVVVLAILAAALLLRGGAA